MFSSFKSYRKLETIMISNLLYAIWFSFCKQNLEFEGEDIKSRVKKKTNPQYSETQSGISL